LSCAEAPQKTSTELALEKPAKVTLTNTDGNHQLFVNGEPFYSKAPDWNLGISQL